MTPEDAILGAASRDITLTLRWSHDCWHVNAQRVVERQLSAFYRCAIGHGQSADLLDAIEFAVSECLSDLDSYTIRCSSAQPTEAKAKDLLNLLNLPKAPVAVGAIRRS